MARNAYGILSDWEVVLSQGRPPTEILESWYRALGHTRGMEQLHLSDYCRLANCFEVEHNVFDPELDDRRLLATVRAIQAKLIPEIIPVEDSPPYPSAYKEEAR